VIREAENKEGLFLIRRVKRGKRQGVHTNTLSINVRVVCGDNHIRSRVDNNLWWSVRIVFCQLYDLKK
jgi:hypothetical protein